MEIELQDFIEIVEFVKGYDGKFTKQDMWEAFKNTQIESIKPNVSDNNNL